jgi:hypothetical protein
MALHRRGLLPHLHSILDERADGLGIHRQIGLALRLAEGLEDRTVRSSLEVHSMSQVPNWYCSDPHPIDFVDGASSAKSVLSALKNLR